MGVRAKEVLSAILISFILTVHRYYEFDDLAYLPQDDKGLIQRIQKEIIPPSELAYNLWESDKECWGQSLQIRIITALTRNMTGGFFVESGAHNGESMTNTLLLERSFGWKGVLIEPSVKLFSALQDKHRKAHTLRSCLSNKPSAFAAMFRDQLSWGLGSVEDGDISQYLSDKYKEFSHPSHKIPRYHVTCYPLYSILLALNQTEVDFFSLDIEGMEMGVLAYMPWSRVNIQILLVENFMAQLWNPQSEMMRWFMESNGYTSFRLEHDFLFVKKTSRFAENAAQIVRQTRAEIAKSEEPSVANPFND